MIQSNNQPDYESIGTLADTLDNLAQASRLPIPADLHLKCMVSAIERASDDLKALYRAHFKTDPWAH